MLLSLVDGDLRIASSGPDGICPDCGLETFAMQSQRTAAWFWAHAGKASDCAYLPIGRLRWADTWRILAPRRSRDCDLFGERVALVSPTGFSITLEEEGADPWRLISQPDLVGRRAFIYDWTAAEGYAIAGAAYRQTYERVAGAPRPVWSVASGWDPTTRIAPCGPMRLPEETWIATAPIPTIIDFGPRVPFVLRVAGDSVGQDERARAFAINRRWLAEHVALVMHGAADPHPCLADLGWDGQMPEGYSPRAGGAITRKPEPQIRLPI